MPLYHITHNTKQALSTHPKGKDKQNKQTRVWDVLRKVNEQELFPLFEKLHQAYANQKDVCLHFFLSYKGRSERADPIPSLPLSWFLCLPPHYADNEFLIWTKEATFCKKTLDEAKAYTDLWDQQHHQVP